MRVEDAVRKTGLLSRAHADLDTALGRVLRVTCLTAYPADGGDPTEFYQLDPPAECAALSTSHKWLDHWNDEWLDPYWDLELLSPHPKLSGFVSFWTFGLNSYCVDGKVEPTTEFVIGEPIPLITRIRRKLNL